MSAYVPSQPVNLPLFITAEKCAGGTYIVTGANGGLGLEAAKHLVAIGAAKVIMGVRNVPSGQKAKAAIEAETGIRGVAEVWSVDLSSYDSVKAFASRAAAELDRVDALIENAAIVVSDRVMAEGHILPVTVNVMSTFLLALLMLPKLSESAKRFGIVPHLVIVSSRASYDAAPVWEKIKDDPLTKMDKEVEPVMLTYPLSKLVEIFAVRQLAQLLPQSQTGVVMNLVCPGLCKTELSNGAPDAFKAELAQLHEKFGRTPEDGSRTLLHGAVAGQESHGRIHADCTNAEDSLPKWITDAEGQKTQERVWGLIASELESISPNCLNRMVRA